ncbi:MAG: MFS transporter [Dehalococcoidales bacterium]|nr:MFS transporter [Dehalococcoidales bacterium]
MTGAFVAAVPFSCMPVLFKEISEDLGLNLVQIGAIWGIASFAGIFVSLIAGVLTDKFGVKLILSVSCILVGITGALRGLSDSFFTLAFTVFINGIVRLIIPITVTNTVGIWFKGRNLGMAMGIYAMGMGFGLMLGPMISATVLSPALGGWRNVMYFYGVISVVVGILWALFGREPYQDDATAEVSGSMPLRQSFSKLIRIKALWFIGLTLLFRVGTLMGMSGYLPLYLRDRGWAIASADGTLAAFYGISTICVVPLSYLSDRIGSRKAILFPALVVSLFCVGLIPFVDGASIWVLMIVCGIFMDGFMSLAVTMLLETEGVGPVYSGTALGMVFTIVHIGSVASPPLGNSLAAISPGTPFLFWASLSIVALVMLFFIKETGWKRIKS